MTPGPFYADDAVTIWHADALDLPLDDASVDLVVTSPPYFGLRSYQDGGQHYDRQIGSEATPAEFVDALIAATREMVRVLKPSGSIFVNLGDRYSGGTSGDRNNGFNERSGNASGKRTQERSQTAVPPVAGVRPKSLIGVPWRYALRCIDDLGLILRAEIIWSKPNHLPESVQDRVARAHEQWFHLVKQPRYYSAVDTIREPYSPNKPWGDRGAHKYVIASGRRDSGTLATPDAWSVGNENPLGKLPGSVWEVPTQPLVVPPDLGVDHFAAFPMEWPRRIILGWSPSGVCTACEQGRRPVASVEKLHNMPRRVGVGAGRGSRDENLSGFNAPGDTRASNIVRTVGEACECPDTSAPTHPAIVLDPFGGTGTTALVARVLGRHAIHVDLSADYCLLARWRVTDPGERARAMHVEKPPPPPPGMESQSLLDLITEG